MKRSPLSPEQRELLKELAEERGPVWDLIRLGMLSPIETTYDGEDELNRDKPPCGDRGFSERPCVRPQGHTGMHEDGGGCGWGWPRSGNPFT
jgi:hypothetical protein